MTLGKKQAKGIVRRGKIVSRIAAALPLGILGFTDEGWPGFISGLLFGYVIVGGLIGIVIELCAWVITGDFVDEEIIVEWREFVQSKNLPPLKRKSVFACICLFFTLCAVVGPHEVYWFFNGASVGFADNVARTITTELERGLSRSTIGRDVNTSWSRWAMAGVTARPLRWVLTEENVSINLHLLDLGDMIDGQSPRRSRRQTEAILTYGLGFLSRVSDKALSLEATMLRDRAFNECERCLNVLWIKCLVDHVGFFS